MSSVFISGASGFIGRALVERLRRDGVEVSGVDVTPDPDAGVVAGDISERDSWREAAVGAETVIHTAALVTNAASAADAWRVNVAGTRRMLDAAKAGGAKRFVHFSSVRAFGDRGFPDQVDESHPVRPDGNTYVDTKIASEQVVLQAHAAGEIEATIIRPGDVYGPGSRPWTILIVEAIKAGRFLLPAMGKGIFSPVYVDNLVDGVLAAARSDGASGQVLTISDGTFPTTREFFGHYFRMLGKRGPLCVPTPLALAAVAIPEAVARLTGTETEIRRAAMIYLARDAGYSIAKARGLLGYEPEVDLEEGMRRTEAWLRERGMLRG